MMVRVDFEPVGRRGECPSGNTLLECARLLGVGLANLCGGSGTCGRCIVQVMDGDVTEPAQVETRFLTPEKLADGYRLACRTVPLGNCKVRVPPESLTAPQRTQVEGEETTVAPEPVVQIYSVTLSKASVEDLRADAERLEEALAEQHGLTGLVCDLVALRELSPRLRDGGWQVRAAVRGQEVIAIVPPAARILGVAVDLGTTKIAAYLVDLETGRTLASEGLMNPQIAYGEDVVARMAHAQAGPAEAAHMQGLVVEVLNRAVAKMCELAGVLPTDVLEMVLVGNTAMHHLFLRLPVEQLARAPYVAAVASAMDVRARDLGLQLAPGAYVHLLPNVAGYVGADHIAMLLASEMSVAGGVVLALDIGTNTEVCLSNHGRKASASCASGPAFEGAHIKHGMRAADGAIERVRLVDGKAEFQTIGGVPPVGLCGSGILDTLAELHRAGIVDIRGKMGEHPNVRGTGGQSEFLLVGVEGANNGHTEITFTQKDVRELQLAKGAMRTGINVLLRKSGLAADDIDRVIIAGAFGTYIDVANAITIGMLPALPLERFSQVGNAAGMGAKLALISRSKRAEAQTLAKGIEYVELAADPEFSRMFAQSMYLGN